MKKYSIALLGIISVFGHAYSMEEAQVDVGLAGNEKIELSSAQFELLKSIIDSDIKSMLEEGAPYFLPSVDKAGLEFILKNVESIKNNDKEALKTAFKELYDSDNAAQFVAVLHNAAYLIIDPILAAGSDFINGDIERMLKKPDYFNALIELQKKQKQATFFDKEKMLFLIADKGLDASVKKLIEAGANLNKQDENGKTVLMRILGSVKTERRKSVRKGYTEIIPLLIEKEADLNIQDMEGRTALIWAIKLYGMKRLKEEFIKQLIEAGADLNVLDEEGNTALISAIGLGDTDSAKILIEAKADLDIKGAFGYTALMWASYQGDSEFVKQLIKAGADKNIQGKEGKTALMLASDRGWKDIVKQLIDAGADLDREDDNGETALILAVDAQQEDIVEMLKQAGAK